MNHFKHSLSRRDLFRLEAFRGAGYFLPQVSRAHELQRSHMTVRNHNIKDETGSRRLSVEKIPLMIHSSLQKIKLKI